MPSTLSSLSLQLFLLSNLTNLTMATDERKDRVNFRLAKDCKPKFIRLDNWDHLEVTSNVDLDEPSPVEAGVTCTAHFMTGQPDHGICIRSNDIYFKFKRTGLDIKFYTSKLGPEKVLRSGYSEFSEWCTREPLVTIEISTDSDLKNQDDEYRYSFKVHNISLQDMEKTYYMDSFKHCNLSYDMESGEELVVITQRYPPASNLPSSCYLSLATKATDEYEELCVTLEGYYRDINCHSKLEVRGFMERFWPKTQTLGCNDYRSVLKKEEMCSGNKKLVMSMLRTNDTDTGFYAKAVIKSKRHPKWKLLSQESVELEGLSFMKGLTFFIATVDSLAAVLAAMLATMCRHPMSFWKDWVETLKSGSNCEPVHYHVSYPEPSGDRVEEITEAKAY